MRKTKTQQPSAMTTRQRILAAAVRHFSRQSYEATGLRDIAADAGVDVAYVHRCFGSKEQLFAAALRETIGPSRRLMGSSETLPENLAGQIFAREFPGANDEVSPLDIIIRSLSSREAALALREFVLDEFIVPLANKLNHGETQRAALVAALLAGVGIFRKVLQIEPLLEAEGGELETLIVRAIRTISGPRPGSQGHRASSTAVRRQGRQARRLEKPPAGLKGTRRRQKTS